MMFHFSNQPIINTISSPNPYMSHYQIILFIFNKFIFYLLLFMLFIIIVHFQSYFLAFLFLKSEIVVCLRNREDNACSLYQIAFELFGCFMSNFILDRQKFIVFVIISKLFIFLI